MPIYEYACEKGHHFEVLQRMADEPIKVCEVCGRPVERVLHPVAVHFKGSGFYNTDYGTRKRQRETKNAAESGAEKNTAKAAEKKADDSAKSDGTKNDSKAKSKPSSSSGTSD